MYTLHYYENISNALYRVCLRYKAQGIRNFLKYNKIHLMKNIFFLFTLITHRQEKEFKVVSSLIGDK